MANKGLSLWRGNHSSGQHRAPTAVVGISDADSVFELSSIITDTRFDFDDQVLQSKAYQRAMIYLGQVQPQLKQATETPGTASDTASLAGENGHHEVKPPGAESYHDKKLSLDALTSGDILSGSDVDLALSSQPPEPSPENMQVVVGGEQPSETPYTSQIPTQNAPPSSVPVYTQNAPELVAPEDEEVDEADVEQVNRPSPAAHQDATDVRPIAETERPVTRREQESTPAGADVSPQASGGSHQVDSAESPSTTLVTPAGSAKGSSRWQRLMPSLFRTPSASSSTADRPSTPLVPYREAEIRRKLVIVGDPSGKTALVVVFSKGTFSESNVPTVFENYVADVEVDGKPLELAVWDTAGVSDYDRLRPLSYPDSHAVILTFSLINRDSFENVEYRVCSPCFITRLCTR
jgi:hypothetical protein